VVYAAKRAGDTADHIFWKSVAGGLESKITMAGTQRNPRVSGPLVAFESSDGGPWDIYVFDTSTNTLYRITDTPAANETLSDIAVSSTGQVRVVYASDATGDSNVYAFTFQHAVNPSQRLSDLIAKIGDAGWLHSVKVKLDNALTKLDNGHLGPSCNLLSAASNEIRALSGRKIEAPYGTELNDSINRIRDAAGCR
jgi:beta propeller repeat protein